MACMRSLSGCGQYAPAQERTITHFTAGPSTCVKRGPTARPLRASSFAGRAATLPQGTAYARPVRTPAVAERSAGAEEYALSPESLEARDFAIAMAKVASDVKVQDLSVLHVEPLVSWTSYMVICSVFSKPQLLAVLARMEDAALQDWDRTKQNNVGSSPWEVIDFGDVLVHVFTPEQREFYDIESFYAAAEEVDLPFEAQQQQQQQQAAVSPSAGTSGWRKTI